MRREDGRVIRARERELEHHSVVAAVVSKGGLAHFDQPERRPIVDDDVDLAGVEEILANLCGRSDGDVRRPPTRVDAAGGVASKVGTEADVFIVRTRFPGHTS